MKLYLGIDPGVTGAVVIIDDEQRLQGFFLWPQRQSFLASVAPQCVKLAAIEKVSSRTGQGVVGVFTFGQNFGHWLGILEALKLPHILVTPQTWQKAVLDFQVAKEPPKPGASKKEDNQRLARNKAASKKATAEFVVRRFPELAQVLAVKKNWGIADAACLALYALKVDRG
jgi:hypothetical protein